MRKANITKNYLILCLKKYISEHYTKKITVRGIAAYAGTSTQPIYLNFSSMQQFKEAMVADVFLDIHKTTNPAMGNVDALYSYWFNYYAFACRNQYLFYALFLENIGCGHCVQDHSYHYFVESINQSEVFANASCKDIRKIHDEALIFFVGLILTYPKKVDMMDLPSFMQDTQDYWYRRIVDPKTAYKDIIPQSLIDAGLIMWDE
ncbi:hypothetical protein A5886_000079 [Enterococcus sp. 8G7_MSG3316]|uniref:HTH tetR-type domain-containing protein n=1 Tax=Candidatus Enterococcus testudinis TaxID=1834191 RepID=A0A242A1X0_9ENTE|nr:TetR/AcrR family transcriptional regulator [Enterococcus sp. 8G7_MSG3316]OTN75035.1 hypothetical protein A5886_000079 [Enterococcus sp. 8G7_MSG3316]